MTANNCTKCPERLPSCVGSSDGLNPSPRHLWKDDYISCFLNRTMVISKCPKSQYFNPRLSMCVDYVPTGKDYVSKMSTLKYKPLKYVNKMNFGIPEHVLR